MGWTMTEQSIKAEADMRESHASRGHLCSGVQVMYWYQLDYHPPSRLLASSTPTELLVCWGSSDLQEHLWGRRSVHILPLQCTSERTRLPPILE